MWAIYSVGNSIIGFSSETLVFCERKSDLLVKKRLSCCSFVMSGLIESFTVALLYRATEAICSWAYKRGKCQKHIKNTHFSINLLVFCKRFARITSNSQESRANHSHRSVLKSDESNLRFKKWAILSQRAKGQIPNPGYLSSYNGLHERYGWICVDMIQTEFVLPFLWFYGLWRVEDPDLILIRVEWSVLCHGKKESFTFLIIDVRVSSKYIHTVYCRNKIIK